MKQREEPDYRICLRCVMDTSDPDIIFDAQGHCNHCRGFSEIKDKIWFPNEEGLRLWSERVKEIKIAGRGKPYDCLIGISGGLDSAYLAYKLKEYDLRILAVHVDSGWNTKTSVENMDLLVRKLGLELSICSVDWSEMRDLQRAFFEASLANLDVPQDHAFFAQLYRKARRHRIPYFLSGGNFATECILPRAWGYNAMDLRHLSSVHARFGKYPLNSFPKLGFWGRFFWYPYVVGLKEARPLNFMPYNRALASSELKEALGWQDYGAKHHESRFTRFFQTYYLPTKFGFEKRRAHLSSLVATGQMTREKALKELASPVLDAATIQDDKRFVAERLGWTPEEFAAIMRAPPRTYRDYPSNAVLFEAKAFGGRIRRLLFRR